MIADPYDNVFKDGKLTHLMIIKKGARNAIPKKIDYPLYCLLKSFLNNYDIAILGATTIGDYEVRGVCLDTNFDTDNELILRELYAFTSGRVNISIITPLSDNSAFAFWYDLKDYTCTLEQYRHGDTLESTNYDTLTEMLEALEAREKEAK